MLRSFIAILATAALALKLAQRRQRHQRMRHDHHRHREDVSRWESEGGNLPPCHLADPPEPAGP